MSNRDNRFAEIESEGGETETPQIHVLVVDDDQVVLQVLRRHLGRIGYNVLQARNGLEALALLDTQHIDVVICDVRMPILDGTCLAEYLHALTRRPHLILIGRDLRAPSTASAVHCADAVLPKPIVPETLEQTLIHLLAGRP